MQTRLSDLLEADLLCFDSAAAALQTAVVGFDGFVDQLARIIKSRGPGDHIELVPTISDFGAMVSGAAGRSFGRELVVKSVEAGGNAPNLADGLISLGIGVDFFGSLGEPIDPAFAAFAARCRSCTSIGPCGRTLALEFGDGKLMLNDTTRLAELTPGVMHAMIDAGHFTKSARGASLLGFANWSRYPHMTTCWRIATDRVLSGLTHRPWVIVDLADPSGKDAGEIVAMADVIRSMALTCRVAFGANLSEAGVLLDAMDEPAPAGDSSVELAAAEALHRRLGVHMAAVHSQLRAGASWAEPEGDPAWRSGRILMNSVFNPKPVRTTGVGDRFNAGLGAGLVTGMPPQMCLALACAAGAWFVTAGRSLTPGDIPALRDVLRS